MRKINSEFQTLHISEEGKQISNRDYFGYVEMDDFACYVLADSLDEEPSVNSARLVVESIIRDFTERPTLSTGTLKRYIKRAHKELFRQRGGMHLKASVVVAVTDYQKFCCCHAGNSRLYWIRNARILFQTKDQSLTQNLVEQKKLSLDEAAAHEERNNLYSYLGDRTMPKVECSRKRKLEDGDLFAMLTRGVWEECGETEFLQIVNEAKAPEDILNRTEDIVLKAQDDKKIDNYTLAVTFVNKVYQSPKKPLDVKKLLMIILPILITVITTSVLLYVRYRSKITKTEAMLQYLESGEEYLDHNNYQKAAEEYAEAKKLADSLKRTEEYEESDRYGKLAEQLILADEALSAGEYEKAQELFLAAREMSVEAGNVGMAYLEGQLDRTESFIEVFDLIADGERKEEYGNLEGAIELYKQARKKAAEIYFLEGKAEAMELQQKAEQALELEELEAQERIRGQVEAQAASVALENEQKANDQKNAIDLENQGNELLAQGSYESAITFYQAAQSIYYRLEWNDMANGINAKISAANAGIEAREALAREAEQALNAEE